MMYICKKKPENGMFSGIQNKTLMYLRLQFYLTNLLIKTYLRQQKQNGFLSLTIFPDLQCLKDQKQIFLM